MDAKNIRNVAIIAHVDHGKTTLVDQLLKQNNVFRENQMIRDRFLDSNDLERERGITIFSKNISIRYKNFKINLIDTPGHSDFSGEVERVLKMADGVLLLVDAFEGTMPQTKFVLKKALEINLKPIVIINKMDRPNSRPNAVLDEIYDLFIDLGADDKQLNFPVIYTSAKEGWASREPGKKGRDMIPLMDAIIDELPSPKIAFGTTQLQITTIDYSPYTGRIGIGRIFRGDVSINIPYKLVTREGKIRTISIKKLYTFEGLNKVEATKVNAGDICAVVGIVDINIGDTITDFQHPEPMPIISIDEPTISMNIMVNNSPFYGKEGRYVSNRHLRDRLFRELESDVALRVSIEEKQSIDVFKVSGRGILHLAILMENMRREGYEFLVGQPQVIYKKINGEKAEPVEELVVEVPANLSGRVIEIVKARRASIVKMEEKGNIKEIVFHIPSRGLIGLRNKLLTATSGEAVIYHRYYQYEYFKGSIPGRKNGVIVSKGTGYVTAFALDSLQDRGRFFVGPGVKVYRGQIVGEHNKDGDINVNLQKTKKLTNVRASRADRAIKVITAHQMSLEECLEFIQSDELVEITPKSIRMRKVELDELKRKRLYIQKVLT